MKSKFLLPLLIGSALLSSCSQKFSADQKAKLSTLTLSPVVQVEKAYQDPRGAADGTMNNVAVATGGGLIGALIGAGTEAVQNNSFKKAEGANFARLRAISPKSVSSQVGSEVQKALKANPFTSSRLRPQSDNKVVTKINRYSLTRVGKRPDGRLLMSPQISAQVEIQGADGKSIGNWPFVTGVSSRAKTVGEWVNSPADLKRGYQEAATSVGQNFAANLAAKTAE